MFKVEDLAGKVEDLQLKETDTEIRIELAADVLFDFDKANIGPRARTLNRSRIIREKAKGTVRVEGHTDSKGSDPFNQKLSVGRNWDRSGSFKGRAKKRALFNRGFGAKNPAVSNTKPDGSDTRREDKKPAGGNNRKEIGGDVLVAVGQRIFGMRQPVATLIANCHASRPCRLKRRRLERRRTFLRSKLT